MTSIIFKLSLVLTSVLMLNNISFFNSDLPTPDKYEKLWDKVEQYDEDALPKSALETVEEIYELAMLEKNDKQIIKATIYRMKYTNILEEDGYVKSIQKLESDIITQTGVPKAMLHMLLATMYSNYYYNNSYLIDQRSVTYDFEQSDLKTWDKSKFKDKIIKNYMHALSDDLKEIDIDEYIEFIDYAKESEDRFPTLYDFVAYTAINGLNTNNYYYYYGSPDKEDNIVENAYLSKATDFVTLPVDADTLSYKYTKVKIYQKWIDFRLKNQDDLEALLFADIMRLDFVKTNMSSSNKELLWLSTLEKMHYIYYSNPELTMIDYALANYYISEAAKYNFKDSTKLKYKIFNKKAHTLLSQTLTQYPDACYSPECHNLKTDLEKIVFSFQVDNIVSAENRFPIRISYKNTEKVYLTVIKCDYNKYLGFDKSYYDDDYFQDLQMISEKIISSKPVNLPSTIDLNTHYTEYLVDSLSKGYYIMFLHAKPELKLEDNYLATSKMFVSNLSLTSSGNYYNNSGYYVFDRNTGEPIKNAKVEAYKHEYSYMKRKYVYTKVATEYTDDRGYVGLEKIKNRDYYNVRIDISKNGDYISETTYSYYYNNDDNNVAVTEVKFFTDRAIYRPGQTINFKGICITKKGENVKLLTDYSTIVYLYDVNYQEVGQLHLRTNEFGSFNGTFDIPLDVLTGNFHLSCSGGSEFIKVEEYKRPMFEVEMLPIEGEYRIGDTVYSEGTAMTYAGTALTDANVSYRIVRNPLWWGYYRGGSFTEKEVAFGEVKVDDDGKFKIAFKASSEDFGNMNKYIYYYYTIYVSATDINGETQSSSTMVYVSDIALSISNDFYGNLELSNIDSLAIHTNNVSGIFVPAIVDVDIYLLEDPEFLLAKRQWEIVDKPLYSEEQWHSMYPGNEFNHETEYTNWQVLEKVFSSKVNTAKNKKVKLKGANKWSPGVYRIVLKSKDKWGNNVENISEFVVFSSKSNKMPYTATSFFMVDKSYAQPGEIVNFYVGSSYKDVSVLFQMNVKGKTSVIKIIKLDSELLAIPIEITEEHRGGISIDLMFIKNGRIYTSNQNVSVGWENKTLDLKFLTYRDKTLPGAKENWKIKITDNNGDLTASEFLASMYDASLDIYAKKSWSWSIYPYYYSYLNWSRTSFTYAASSQTYDGFYPDYVNNYHYNPTFNFFGMSYFGNNRYDYYSGGRSNDRGLFSMKTESAAVPVSASMDGEIMDDMDSSVVEQGIDLISSGESTMSLSEDKRSEATGGKTRNGKGKDVQIRSNFSETAFFYPNLVTDENGEILISFTMPESLTRWNFMGFAHTKDLQMGQISTELVTQKELMIMPNMPRFFRENDKMTLSVKINNVSDIVIVGKTSIEFFDPITQENLNSIFLVDNSNLQSISIKQGKNIAINWNINIPEGLSAVGVRFIAEGKVHSDGEERVVPILTNRMLVTETMPLPVRKSGTTEFTMTRLKNSESSSTLRHHRYTLEFTNNPAWYAVQALPYIMEYPYECAEQTFSRYYANILATHIANSDPKIQRVFEIWKNTPSSEALMSNLEKNQELKALLLEETPWVLEAQNENERKHRIGLLFDLNRMSQQSKSALKKLNNMQKYNGGWPWFNGMRESWYITQHIACGLGHLDNLGVTEVKDNSKTWTMTKKAIGFIDGEIVDSYNNLKKYCDADCMARDNISYMQIHYLYTRSYFIDEIPIDNRTKEAFDYYKGQAEAYWKTKSFYMQGMIALALYRYEEEVVPAKIIASLNEHAQHSEEMGMYWKSDRGYYWYQAPIETHALLIEVYDEVANDQVAVEEIKVWLLKQKQTQDWKTTKATAEAIYALLLRGTNLLSDDAMATIQIGSMKIDPENDPEIKTEAGTGYFKKSWDGSLVKPEWGDVKVTKSTNTVSWGAIYWQYFEQLDKITDFEETPLKINKKLFVERREGAKPVIVQIEKDANLEVGDKVTVRIEIRVDRDMEYVHLKDMRASCFEPVDYLSGYRYKAGLGYYQGIKDASMNFFIDYLKKGTYVFEYKLVVAQKGDFSNGVTTIQSMYAPEFTSHSGGVRVQVK